MTRDSRSLAGEIEWISALDVAARRMKESMSKASSAKVDGVKDAEEAGLEAAGLFLDAIGFKADSAAA